MVEINYELDLNDLTAAQLVDMIKEAADILSKKTAQPAKRGRPRKEVSMPSLRDAI